MERTFVVRPFKQVIDRAGAESLVLSGSIECGAYVFRIGEVPFELRTTMTGDDEIGPFARVRDAEAIPAYGGWVLAVEAEYEEPIGEMMLDPGCAVRFFKPGDRETYEAIVRRAGADPRQHHVLVPADDPGWAAYFDSLGNPDGVAYPGEGGE